ncbi:hypothetical protein HJFPF1_04176 [Paramyrothecium foliicola]|nr:hypothetical protein HJFPF1_04176 [Paramyrothecium foliicola]
MMYKAFITTAAVAFFIASASANSANAEDRTVERRQSEGWCAERTNTCWDSSGELGDCERGDCTADNNKCTVERACGGMGFCDSWVVCE